MAVWLGGEVELISIAPDKDDGPNRSGETTIRWPAGRFSERRLQEAAVMVALAGPVAEMIHRGDPFHPATVAEWRLDWQLAWQAATFVQINAKRMELLEQSTIQLHQVLSQDNHWAAIGAIVDHLLAYETLEGETVHEVVSEWSS